MAVPRTVRKNRSVIGKKRPREAAGFSPEGHQVPVSDHMREVASLVDDVHGWHDQGGWSQARYQRGIAKEAHDHIKHAADELFKRFKSGAVQRLIIGTPQELRGEIEASLHSYLRDR